MNYHPIKRDTADKEFSRFIRLRDKKCMHPGCTKQGTGEEGITGLECSHYWSRRAENVRYDPENAEALCHNHHQKWEHQKEIKINNEVIMGEYALYKIKQLGRTGYELLKFRSNQFKKKDRKISLLIVRELIKRL